LYLQNYGGIRNTKMEFEPRPHQTETSTSSEIEIVTNAKIVRLYPDLASKQNA